MKRAVLDTNVLVSGLLNPDGPPGRILDLLLLGELQPVFDERILLEYRRVLLRPRFAFPAREVGDLLDYLRFTGLALTAPPLAAALPDPSDLPFLEAAAASLSPLVSGNLRRYPLEGIQPLGGRVMTPAEFVKEWGGD